MLEGKVIFILSLMKFDGLPSTNFTVAKYLAKNNEVYYIEHPYTFKDYLTADRKSDEFRIRKSGWRKKDGILERKIQGLHIVIGKPILPVNFLPRGKVYDKLNNLNEWSIAKNINRIVRKRGIDDFIFINFYDYNLPLVGKKINSILNIYYCVDPVPEYFKKHGVANELNLLKNSDLVICTSRALYEEKKKVNVNTHYIPNGSDLVNDVNYLTVQASPKLSHIKKPIVGYIGAIESRIDYAMLKNVFEKNPDISFVFVGPVFKEHLPSFFLNQKNVFILGPVNYNDVPEVMQAFDVCMIPFKKTETSGTVFPLKLFEYLGMGKPVVATDFNSDLINYTGDLVYYASDSKTFGSKIVAALSERCCEKQTERVEVAKRNTWSARLNKFSDIVFKNLVK